jgi:hypothetical protein
VTGLLADADVKGQVAALIAACRGPSWRELWDGLAMNIYSFADVGLALNAPDQEVWRTCQLKGLLLVTGNRNAESPDSLEATIRALGTADSLPVITLADRDRVLYDRDYAERAAGRLIDFMLEIDRYRGTGRLFIP